MKQRVKKIGRIFILQRISTLVVGTFLAAVSVMQVLQGGIDGLLDIFNIIVK